MTNDAPGPQPPAAPEPQGGGGTVRIVIGIVLLVLIVLGALGSVGQASAGVQQSGGAAATLGAVVFRLASIALGIVLIVSGVRARRRRAEASREAPPRDLP